jgi:uncharacterized protein (TIGR04551 family)
MLGHARLSRYVALIFASISISTLVLTIASSARAQGPDGGTPAASADPDGGAPPPAPVTPVTPVPAPAPRPASPRDALLPPAPSASPSAGASISGTGAASTSLPPVDPAADARELANQAKERPTTDGTVGARPSEVYSEDWWSRVRPIFEVHGYFRTRGELHHNFFLGRHDNPGADPQNLWPIPLDQSYADTGGTQHNVRLCGDDLRNPSNCIDKSQATANMRFRIAPELHISDNLRIMSTVDMLDNLVLGSTPDSYAMSPGSATGSNSGYRPAVNGYNGYAPLAFFSNTQAPPTAGVNSLRNSIDVKRAWAEYMTPVGQLRFGRMPQHWGLGMLWNAGDGIDHDYHSTIDRIMFVTGIKAIDLYLGGEWDFMSTGPNSSSPYDVAGGQPYSTGNLTNVNQWGLFLARRTNPDLQRLALSRNQVVFNGGLYALYRSQYLDIAGGSNPYSVDTSAANTRGLERRGAQAVIPDLWLQLLYEKFRFEAELATMYGEIDRTPQLSETTKLRQWGLATQTEYKAVEDKLRLNFGFGWASGDPWATSLNPGETPQVEVPGRGAISTFRFNPSYQVDLIFFRKILTRVEGAYYFRPSVEYDFIRSPNGQKFGGGAAIIWSRASEFVQTPGHKRDLGVELDLNLYYQAKDGALNDDPDKIGGFYTMLQYGVFFPLGGLSYLPGEQTSTALPDWTTSSAHTLRLFLGVAY